VVTQTAAISIGARLIAFDESDKITRIEDAGRTMMKELGHQVKLGQTISDKMKEDFGAYMAKILFETIEVGPNSPMANSLMVTPPFVNYRGFKQFQHIVFSGGVSEHVYDRDPKTYGDIGPVLGRNVREYLKKLPKDVLREPIEGIRATVIGAGEYTIQASGNTSYVSNEKALPVHGLKVIQAPIRDGESVSEAIKQALRKFDLSCFTSGLALSLTVSGVPDYQSVRRIAEGVATSAHIDAAPSGTHFVGASMKWFMRLTGEGVGMHVGILPGYPASHGCIRMPEPAAAAFYAHVKVGTPVRVDP
jgi:ethanolamine utilization protein EutA